MATKYQVHITLIEVKEDGTTDIHLEDELFAEDEYLDLDTAEGAYDQARSLCERYYH